MDNYITLAMNQTADGFRYVYWHGSDNQRYAPQPTIEYTVGNQVPEQTTMFLFSTGIAGLAAVARSKRK